MCRRRYGSSNVSPHLYINYIEAHCNDALLLWCALLFLGKEGEQVIKNNIKVLDERKGSILQKSFCSGDGSGINCEKASVSGAVSQRACVYCGARVVLNPITDAYHIVHGPIGCASYT